MAPVKKKRSDEVPVIYKKDEDGKDILPRTQDGNAGGVYTLDDRDETDLPTEFNAANEDNKRDTADMLLAAGAAAALMKKRKGHQVPGTLPPYVHAHRSDEHTSYSFIPPEEARDLGFRETIFLGEDHDKGELAGIMARGNALASQVRAALKREQQELERRQDHKHEAHRVADNTRAALGPQVAVTAGMAAANDDTALMEYQNMQMDEYNRISSEALQRDLSPDNPADEMDNLNPYKDDDDEKRLRNEPPLAAAALTPEDAARKRLAAKEAELQSAPIAPHPPGTAPSETLEPEPPAPK